MVKMLLMFMLYMSLALGANSTYILKAPLFGEVAEVKISHTTRGKKYNITLKLISKGLAKWKSGNRVETYTSKGRIIKGDYYADVYTVKQVFNNIKYLKIYTFNYKKKKIKRVYKKWKDGKLYSNETTYLSYFSHNDLMTIYHNIEQFGSSGRIGNYRINAAGAERGGNGFRFLLPNANETKKRFKKQSMSGKSAMVLSLRRTYLKSGRGEIIFIIDDDGVAKKVTLTNVKYVGTLRAYRK